MVPVEYSEELHRAIRGSHLEVIAGAGHMLPLEKPDEYNRAVAAFMSGISMELA
jgi:pimeloyl-ACP methyl ester carboxylesterase